MGHGLACLPGSGWAVLAILTYYVYAPDAVLWPVPNCLRRRRPCVSVWVVVPTAFKFA